MFVCFVLPYLTTLVTRLLFCFCFLFAADDASLVVCFFFRDGTHKRRRLGGGTSQTSSYIDWKAFLAVTDGRRGGGWWKGSINILPLSRHQQQNNNNKLSSFFFCFLLLLSYEPRHHLLPPRRASLANRAAPRSVNETATRKKRGKKIDVVGYNVTQDEKTPINII